ncbi:MAG: hypothetical protein ABI467_14540 [Kofleriaceae bacterium]
MIVIVIVDVIAPVIVAVHVNGTATVIVIRPVDGVTAAPSGRQGAHRSQRVQAGT